MRGLGGVGGGGLLQMKTVCTGAAHTAPASWAVWNSEGVVAGEGDGEAFVLPKKKS